LEEWEKIKKPEDWNTGMLEYWEDLKEKTCFEPIIPLFQHSGTILLDSSCFSFEEVKSWIS